MNKILGFVACVTCLVGGMLFTLIFCVPMVVWLFLRDNEMENYEKAFRNDSDDPNLDHFMFDGKHRLHSTTVKMFSLNKSC